MPPKRKATAAPPATNRNSTKNSPTTPASGSSSAPAPKAKKSSSTAAKTASASKAKPATTAPKSKATVPSKASTKAAARAPVKPVELDSSDLSSAEEDNHSPPPKRRRPASAPTKKAALAKAPVVKKPIKPPPQPSPQSSLGVVAAASSSSPAPLGATPHRTNLFQRKSSSTNALDQDKPKKEKMAPKKVAGADGELLRWFSQFAEEDDETKMGHEGIEALFEEMDEPMDGVLPFLLAWKIDAPPGSFGTYYRANFEKALKPKKIASSDKLRAWLLEAQAQLYSDKLLQQAQSSAEFSRFYSFVFQWLKDEGQKSLQGGMALAALTIVLAPRYPLAQEFATYAESLGPQFKGVSSDVWSQLLEFCSTVTPDLEGYSDLDAWPTVIDSFVEWKKENKMN